MKSILHEFYYGNINSNEIPLVQSPECKQYLKIVVDTETSEWHGIGTVPKIL